MQPVVANVVLLEGLLGFRHCDWRSENGTDGNAMVFDNSSQRVCQKAGAEMICTYMTVCVRT